MLKPLEVDFYNSKDFWDKPQEERYKYFKCSSWRLLV